MKTEKKYYGFIKKENLYLSIKIVAIYLIIRLGSEFLNSISPESALKLEVLLGAILGEIVKGFLWFIPIGIIIYIVTKIIKNNLFFKWIN